LCEEPKTGARAKREQGGVAAFYADKPRIKIKNLPMAGFKIG